MMRFGGIEEKYCYFSSASVLLQAVPYDGTSTWIKGADRGFEAFLEAAENMELYDIETDTEVFKKGIHILPAIREDSSPEAVFNKIYKCTKELLESGKFLTFFGGEHAISIGIIKAFYEKYQDITILQFDAHADLRPFYLGSKYNHACALHDAYLNTNLVQIGIRSMDSSEKEFINKDKCFLAKDIVHTSDWYDDALNRMNDPVYITLDLDVFDPSILPATGTPEPGGLDWYSVTAFIRKVFASKNVVGFDIVELAPIKNNRASEFLVAKLYYKMLSYKFCDTVS